MQSRFQFNSSFQTNALSLPHCHFSDFVIKCAFPKFSNFSLTFSYFLYRYWEDFSKNLVSVSDLLIALSELPFLCTDAWMGMNDFECSFTNFGLLCRQRIFESAGPSFCKWESKAWARLDCNYDICVNQVVLAATNMYAKFECTFLVSLAIIRVLDPFTFSNCSLSPSAISVSLLLWSGGFFIISVAVDWLDLNRQWQTFIFAPFEAIRHAHRVNSLLSHLVNHSRGLPCILRLARGPDSARGASPPTSCHLPFPNYGGLNELSPQPRSL